MAELDRAAAAVIKFWRDAGREMNGSKGRRVRRRFRDRFLDLHFAAARREMRRLDRSAEGALALMILLDQFPRNCFRGSGHMYATDPLARHFARKALAAGQDLAVDQDLRAFFHLPFEHSENLADQQICVELTRAMGEEMLKHATSTGTSFSGSAVSRTAIRCSAARRRRRNRRSSMPAALPAEPAPLPSAMSSAVSPSTSRGRTQSARCRPRPRRRGVRQAAFRRREVRRDFGQRHQNESALQHPRVRDFQPALVNLAVAEHQYVDIDQPRAPPLLAHALQCAFGFEAEVEQAAWRQAGRDFGRRVEEVRLVGLAPGRRTVERGDGDDPCLGVGIQHAQRRAHRVGRVAEITAKAEKSRFLIRARQRSPRHGQARQAPGH